MIGIAAKARASEIQQVWNDVALKVEEIVEEEGDILDAKTDEERLEFWQMAQNKIFRRCKKVPLFRFVRDCCYRTLQTLTGLAILLLMGVFVISVFVDYREAVKFVGKVTMVLFRIGVCVSVVSLAIHFVQRWHENMLTYQLAIQQILADDYGLVNDYSSDVNAYAVLMLAANELSLKAAKKVREEENDQKDEETFVVGTDEEIADVYPVDELVDETPEEPSSETSDKASESDAESREEHPE